MALVAGSAEMSDQSAARGPRSVASASSTSSKTKAVCMACRARKKRCNGGRPSCSTCIMRQEPCSYPPARRSSSMFASGQNNHSNTVSRPSTGQQLHFQPYPTQNALPMYPNLAPSALQLNPSLIQTLSGLVATPGSDQSPFFYSSLPPETSPPPLPAAQDLTAMLLGSPGQAAPYAPAAASQPTAFPQAAQPGGWLPSSMPSELSSAASSTTVSSIFEDRGRTSTSQRSTVPSPQTSDMPDVAPSGEPGPEAELAQAATAQLPSRQQMEELCSIFFQRFHSHLPIFSKDRLPTALVEATTATTTTTTTPGRTKSLLAYALFALVAANHPAADVQAQQTAWFETAKHLYGQTSHIPDEPLQTLQAAACIVLHALVVGDHSTSWLVLGKAWRQCVALGYNKMDAPSSGPGLWFVDWRELEERRRTVWGLFMLDRGMCFPLGHAHSIDERQLRVNLPMDENLVQNMESPPLESAHIPFTLNFRKLLSLVGAQQNGPNVFHYLILSYVLLGRIVEHMYWPESDDDDDDNDEDEDDDDARRHDAMLESLHEDLSQMRLMLPRSATDLATAAHSDCIYVVWLNVMMNVNTVFLFHRPPRKRRGRFAHGEEGGQDGSGCSAAPSSNWQLCVVVARNTAMLIREASRVSTDLLMNPMIAAPVFTCARILVIEHILSSAPSHTGGRILRASDFVADLQVLLLMFDRLSESFRGVGAKFRSGVLYHLKQGPENARELKAGGSKELLESCGKWPSAAGR